MAEIAKRAIAVRKQTPSGATTRTILSGVNLGFATSTLGGCDLEQTNEALKAKLGKVIEARERKDTNAIDSSLANFRHLMHRPGNHRLDEELMVRLGMVRRKLQQIVKEAQAPLLLKQCAVRSLHGA